MTLPIARSSSSASRPANRERRAHSSSVSVPLPPRAPFGPSATETHESLGQRKKPSGGYGRAWLGLYFSRSRFFGR